MKVLSLTILIIISGCSNRVGNEFLYGTVISGKSECKRLMIEQKEDCLRRLKDRPTYEEYEKERRLIIEGKSSKTVEEYLEEKLTSQKAKDSDLGSGNKI